MLNGGVTTGLVELDPRLGRPLARAVRLLRATLVGATKMSGSHRESLVHAVEKTLLPTLRDRGFVQHPLSSTEQRSREISAAFPFGRMKRSRGPNLEILEIQFGKRGAARFVLNIGTVPPEGISLPWIRLSQVEAGTSSLPNALRLYSRSTWPKWFSVRWWSLDSDGEADRTVGKAIDLYSEVEVWFTTGDIGKHLRRFGFPTPPTRVNET